MSILRRLTFALLPLAIPLLAAGEQPSSPGHGPHNASQSKNDSSPLIDKVRKATERFKDINVAIAEGFQQGTPCVGKLLPPAASGAVPMKTNRPCRAQASAAQLRRSGR